jgi:putative tricarboxylic transport membrane protein
MADAALEALTHVFAWQTLIFMVFGAGLGLLVGLFPGMGGTVGMSILLPFVFGMDVFQGVAFLVGAMATTNTGDTFPSILLGIPGTGASQATIMDGYPLAKKGKAATALGAAFFSSMAGGILGAIALLGMLFIARPIVLALGSPELFMFTLLGLSMVGVLSRGSPFAGLTAGLLGMLLGTIGGAPATSAYRFTFDSLYLFDGIPLGVFALGLFALPEVLDLLASHRSISSLPTLSGSRWQGVRAVLQHRWLLVRSSLMGTGLAMLPGLGGTVIDWITYGIARQTSRDAESFGRGDIRGLIAPEAANNSKDGGTLIPTLVFGIPGNGSTAILLGGFTLLGLQAGPSMVRGEGLSVSLAMVWTLALANIVGTAICFSLVKPVARLTLVRAQVLMPFLIVIIVYAAYLSSRSWGDIAALLAISALAWLMKQVGWPRPPMLIGFVLAEPAERYLSISYNRFGYGFAARPGVIIVAALIVAIIGSGVWRQRNQRLKTGGSADTPPEGRP